MEVAGAVLGLGAVDLIRVMQVRAVVGDEVEVKGKRLRLAAEGLGQVALQGSVDAALEFRGLRGG